MIEVVWLSREAEEAELRISDGTIDAVAFCHPCSARRGDELFNPLFGFDTSDVQRSFSEGPSIEGKAGKFALEIRGQVLDAAKSLIKVGEILIELDAPLPGDIKGGDWIHARCNRLDYAG